MLERILAVAADQEGQPSEGQSAEELRALTRLLASRSLR
jgi:hypothetical protein